jgi:hypothetical protein
VSSSLTAASSVGPGVAWEPLGGLEVAAVVAPASGVAPLAPRVVAPLARTMYQPILVTEGLAVVTLASVLAVGAGVVEALVLVVEALVLEVGALVVEAGVVEAGVVEALVLEVGALVVEALVLEVAVEAIVVEGLGVVTAVATVGSSTKESTKEPCARLILARSLPSFPPIGITGAALPCRQEKPLVHISLLDPSSSSS